MPRQWQYNSESREKLDWAHEQGMRLRGHPLMWHEVIPDFLTDSERSIAAIETDVAPQCRLLRTILKLMNGMFIMKR